jgi:hypothetical protein
MADKLIPLDIPPGVVRNGTDYQSKGRWSDAQLVRFESGTIKPVGGWRFARKDDGTNVDLLDGKPRGAISWRTDSGDPMIVLATTEKLYVLAAGVLSDITPFGFVTGSENTAPTGGGGNYNEGAFGVGAYGMGASTSTMQDADTWQLDMFGDYLAAVCTSDRKLYMWDGNVASLPTVPAGAPAVVNGVVVTPERFLVALGADNNARLVKWPSQETTTDWVASATNTAGELELMTDGRIVCGRRTRGETLIWTDSDLHALRYIGGQFIYSLQVLGEKCGIVSPRGGVTFDAQAMWMGNKNFFVYDGVVRPLPCTVRDLVFGDFNETQSVKVWATTIAQYGEVWWFYPSAGSDECDRYVVFNYREGHWTTGQLRRAAGFDSGAYDYPVMIAPSGEVFEHEVPVSLRPAVPGENGGVNLLTEDGEPLMQETGGVVLTEDLLPFIESGPIEIGEGDRLMSVQRIITDENNIGDVSATFFTAQYPTADEREHGPYTMSEPTSVRFKARQARIRLDEDRPTDWRIGRIRLGVREGSRR